MDQRCPRCGEPQTECVLGGNVFWICEPCIMADWVDEQLEKYWSEDRLALIDERAGAY